jgi:sec-independent protein translocase protein TatC
MARKKTDRRSFWDHLEDLRRKVLWVLAFFAVAFLAAYFSLGERVVSYLVRLAGVPMYYLSVWEPFLTRIKVSVSLAAVASLPLLFVQVTRFILPGLYRGERRAFLAISSLFVALVGALGYVLFRFSPLLLSYFLRTFATPSVGYYLSINTLISFYLMLLVGDALIILMPVVVFLLYKLGLITPKGLRTSRKVVFAVILVVSAVITPPDPFTVFIVAIPLWLLFEGSLLLLRAMDRMRLR